MLLGIFLLSLRRKFTINSLANINKMKMITQSEIARKDFDRVCELSGYEVFTEKQVSSLINHIKGMIEKSNRETLTPDEIQSIHTYNEDMPELKKALVLNDDMTRELLYYRERQVIFDDAIEKSENGEIMKARTGTYANTSQNRKLGRVGRKYDPRDKKAEDEGKGKSKGDKDEVIGRSGTLSKLMYPLISKAKGFLYHTDGTRASLKSTLKNIESNPNKVSSWMDVTGSMGKDNISRDEMKGDNLNATYSVKQDKVSGEFTLTKHFEKEASDKKPLSVPSIDESLARDYHNGEMTIQEVAEELHEAGRTNSVDTEYAKKMVDKFKGGEKKEEGKSDGVEFKSGQEYETDSNMGGTLTYKFTGEKDGKLQFKNTMHKDYGGGTVLSLTKEDAEKRFPKSLQKN